MLFLPLQAPGICSSLFISLRALWLRRFPLTIGPGGGEDTWDDLLSMVLSCVQHLYSLCNFWKQQGNAQRSLTPYLCFIHLAKIGNNAGFDKVDIVLRGL